MSLAAAAFLSLAAQAQPGQWRTFTYPDGKEMRFQPPEFLESDYPASIIRSGIEGRTMLRLTVSPAGRIVDCAIQESSASAELDARACEVYRARARFELRNFTANHIVRAPVRWRLEATPSVAAAPAAVATPVPSTASPAFLAGRPGANPHAITLGREFQVTADMVADFDSEEFLARYYCELVLNGRTGDRFAISWRGSVPLLVDFEDYDDTDREYPPGQTIFDLAGSVTITLNRDGEHRLDLSQSGVNFAPSNSTLPSFEGRTVRAFIPYYLVVRRLP